MSAYDEYVRIVERQEHVKYDPPPRGLRKDSLTVGQWQLLRDLVTRAALDETQRAERMQARGLRYHSAGRLAEQEELAASLRRIVEVLP